jgi:hypothetical protein
VMPVCLPVLRFSLVTPSELGLGNVTSLLYSEVLIKNAPQLLGKKPFRPSYSLGG